MDKHTHTATPDTRTRLYQVCKCGAVRKLVNGKYDEWHACELCCNRIASGSDS